MNEAPDPEARVHELDRENRILARKLARMESNARQAEDLHDSNSRLLATLMRELEQERAKSTALLLNVLPQSVVDRLGAGETLIADRLDSATVLFSDVVGFTEISASLAADVLVKELNALFSRFDAACDSLGVEKIKTIGDAYLAVGGLPGGREDHVAAVAELALAMIAATADTGPRPGGEWRIRIGVHTGPAVAGVIGTRKFVYDVWGDTVNTASRLETTSEPGRVHVSEPVAKALGSSFRLEPRGEIELKGKGRVRSFYLLG